MTIKLDFKNITSIEVIPSKESLVKYYPSTEKKGFFKTKVIQEHWVNSGAILNKDMVERDLISGSVSKYNRKYKWADETETTLMIKDYIHIVNDFNLSWQNIYFDSLEEAEQVYQKIITKLTKDNNYFVL